MASPPQTMTTREELDFLGCRARVVVDGAETDGRFSLVDMIDVPAGHMPPLHVHRDHEEGFRDLEGEVTLFLPGESLTLTAGDFMLAPRGVPHTYRVGDRPARWLVITSPAGFERFVADVAALDAPDPARLASLAAQYGVDILGPPGSFRKAEPADQPSRFAPPHFAHVRAGASAVLESMSFARYLELEGRCAVALGVVLVLVAAAFGSWDEPFLVAPLLAVLGSALAVVGARAATRSAVRAAASSSPRMPEATVRRQTILETVVWAAAVAAWVAATGSSAALIAGTGVATAVFGFVRLRASVPADVLVDRRLPVIGASATRSPQARSASSS